MPVSLSRMDVLQFICVEVEGEIGVSEMKRYFLFVMLASLVLSACAPSVSGSPSQISILQFSAFSVKKEDFKIPRKLEKPSSELDSLTREWSAKNPKTLDQNDLSRIFSLGYDYDILMINNQIRFFQKGSLEAFQARLAVEAKSTSSAKTKTPPKTPSPVLSFYCEELISMWFNLHVITADEKQNGVALIHINDDGWKVVLGIAGCGVQVSIINGRVKIIVGDVGDSEKEGKVEQP